MWAAIISFFPEAVKKTFWAVGTSYGKVESLGRGIGLDEDGDRYFSSSSHQIDRLPDHWEQKHGESQILELKQPLLRVLKKMEQRKKTIPFLPSFVSPDVCQLVNYFIVLKYFKKIRFFFSKILNKREVLMPNNFYFLSLSILEKILN